MILSSQVDVWITFALFYAVMVVPNYGNDIRTLLPCAKAVPCTN